MSVALYTDVYKPGLPADLGNRIQDLPDPVMGGMVLESSSRPVVLRSLLCPDAPSSYPQGFPPLVASDDLVQPVRPAQLMGRT